MLKTITLFLFASLLAMTTWAQQSSEELKKQQAEIQEEINSLKKSLDATKKDKKVGLGQLSLVQRKLRLRQAAINNINQQINHIENNISQSRNEIDKLKDELDTLKSKYAESVLYAYKNRSNYDFLNFIFSATSFNDALRRIQYLKAYRAIRQKEADDIKQTQALLENKVQGLQSARKEKDVVLEKQEKQKTVLVEEKKEKDAIVAKIKLREKELSKELANKRKADARLRASIKAAIDREIRLARAREAELRKKEGTGAAGNAPAKTETRPKSKSVFEATPEGEIISDNFEKNKGKLPWPVDNGNIKIHFGYYEIPGTKLKNYNPGLTMETDLGAPVKAVFAGEVVSVFDVEGNYSVLVRHGKYFTDYSNLSGVTVSRGQQVKAGQVLGKAVANEYGNGEIEFLLMQEKENLNPEQWIRRR